MSTPAHTIMLQGTMSNVGKSVLTAGLCRILRQDGYRVAPFKSQNMALNSFITSEGLEMGRAQVMQAEAAGIEPSVLMNPILLKPTTDVGSQVIVNGEVLGNMRARDYFRYKKELIPVILDAFHKLQDMVDIIVIEGAGSPAEINLRSNDIVNMGLATMVDAPVLLIGDIDRGGIFASLYGTIALLESSEQARIKGTIINKFRGDVEILRPGLTMLEDLTKVPNLGVIPWFHLDLEDEDSLTPRFNQPVIDQLLDIAVIRLPHISNFTDFHPLEQASGVGVRYVDNVRALGNPDLIILPGTKNTMGDLAWLRQSGVEAAILKKHDADVPIIGICGGYQMLGATITDPGNVEHGGVMRGIGLLAMETEFSPMKMRSRVQGNITSATGLWSSLQGVPFSGYEIHMGRSILHGGAQGFATLNDGQQQWDDGCHTKNVWGCYVHGMFENDAFSAALVQLLFQRKGLDPDQLQPMSYQAFKEQQYDQLADILRAGLDIVRIREIIGCSTLG